MGFPSTDGNKSNSSRHDGGGTYLLTLEEEVTLAANHLRVVQDKLRMAQGSSRSTNSPDNASEDSSHHVKNSDDNICGAMHILHMPNEKER